MGDTGCPMPEKPRSLSTLWGLALQDKVQRNTVNSVEIEKYNIIYGYALRQERALVPVDFGMAANIQQSYVLIITPFREDNPQIAINGYRPFSRSSCR
jgi:hypothetical protein